MYALLELQYIDLSMNRFSGSLPSYVQQWTKLKEIYLQDNSMTGPVPYEFSFLKLLELIDLSENDFSGTMPELICEMRQETLHELIADCGSPNPSVVCELSCCSSCK